MSALEPGDVFTAEDGVLFVMMKVGNEDYGAYRQVWPDGDIMPWSGWYSGYGTRESFDPFLAEYPPASLRYLGHRDTVGRLQGVEL